jgi:hypothetical protein
MVEAMAEATAEKMALAMATSALTEEAMVGAITAKTAEIMQRQR